MTTARRGWRRGIAGTHGSATSAELPRAGRPARRQHLRHCARGHRRAQLGKTVSRSWCTGSPPGWTTDTWVVELRTPGVAKHPLLDGGAPGLQVELPGAAVLTLDAPHAGRGQPTARPGPGSGARGRRWGRAACASCSRAPDGRSATATCAAGWPLAAYQTVFATEPGSAEMPSAGRPFSTELGHRARLVRDRVRGRSCCTPGCRRWSVGEQPPEPERFRVPAGPRRARSGTRCAGVGQPRDRGRDHGGARARVCSSPGPRGAGGDRRRLRRGLDGPRGYGPDRLRRWSSTGSSPGCTNPRRSHLLLLEAVAGAGRWCNGRTTRRSRGGTGGTSSGTCT